MSVKVTTHEADAVDLLVSQYKNKVNMGKLAGIIGRRAQSIEDALWKLVTDRALTTSEGAQLDDIGAILGEERQGRDDDDYRVFLSARILLNRCSGTPEQIIALFVKVLSVLLPGVQAQLVEWADAAVQVLLPPTPGITDDQVAELALLLKRARVAGVQGFITWVPQTAATTLTCGPIVKATPGSKVGATVIATAAPIPAAWPGAGTCFLADDTFPVVPQVSRTFTKTGASQLTLGSAVPAGMSGQISFTLQDTSKGLAALSGGNPVNGGKCAGVKES